MKLYELDFDPGDCGEGGKADLGFFRMGLHAVQPAQMGKALAGWQRVCRIPVVIGDLSDRFYYNGQAEGPYDEFLKGLEGVEALPNPPIADALSRGRPRIVYSPNLDLASTHRRRPSLYVAHDWDALIAALYEQLGPGRSVAFFHDATMHVLKTKER